MRVLVAGGGPAGLCFAGLFRRSFPASSVTVLERDPRGASYGFGVVFSDQALRALEAAYPELCARISPELERWSDLTIVHRNEAVAIDGNGFSGISRRRLLACLEEIAGTAGVDLRHETVATREMRDDFDLVVAADGAHSPLGRDWVPDPDQQVALPDNRFIWYATRQRFETLTLTFRAASGGCFVAHHYRYAPDLSTFIVECDGSAWRNAGLEDMSDDANRAFCERVFTPELRGNPLISNRSVWRRFPMVRRSRWRCGNAVMLGDALGTVHFSIGSGTRRALEDAVALWRAFCSHPDDVSRALEAFEMDRRPAVDRLLDAGAGSSAWYETMAGRMDREPVDLAHDYMTRSGQVDDARLRRIAPRFMRRYQDFLNGDSPHV